MAVEHRTSSAAEIPAAVGTTVTFATRRPGERQQPTCLRPRHTGPTPGVMVWEAISYDSRSTLVVIPRTLTANLYASLVIQPVLLPFMNSIKRVFSNRLTLALIPLL
ncbi:hypothetical protein AVEN_164690-1 [Araneus ventricosus]|uniref:Uncharacterized protein n=1 Tax=Araneus ventricosus TaxID=182803 RepID=A0A4Y2SJB5_ARAVE|nr:hypothetical protein AVEN_80422-1 [Araneus ventricosus]GBN87699.1 hypothetical protein AVEN_164690-1 [Araneus ventricosus]